MRPLLVLLAAILALLAGDTAPERSPSVMLAAVPAAAPAPEDPSAMPDPADSCSPGSQPVLLSAATLVEPGWRWQYEAADSTGTVTPTCTHSIDTLPTPGSE